jgi:hypothetical protein
MAPAKTDFNCAVRTIMMKLSQLVNSALEDAEAKVASARSSEKIASVAAPAPVRTKRANAVAPVAAPATTRMDTATEAMKFAESLEHLAMLFPKIAEGSTQTNDVNGPEVLTSPDKGATHTSHTKARSLSVQQASSGGGSGPDMDIATPPPVGAKQAAEAVLSAKIAQSEALLAAGQAKLAGALAKQAQAEFTQSKQAYDEAASTPHGSLITLPTNVSVSGVAPDNAGMASFTKRDGKSREIAPIAQHVQEPAFSASADRGIQDNFEHTQGAKIALFDALFPKAAGYVDTREKKMDAQKEWETMSRGQRAAHQGSRMAVPGALVGGAVGGYKGLQSASKHLAGGGGLTGAAGRAALGTLAGTALGGGVAGGLGSAAGAMKKRPGVGTTALALRHNVEPIRAEGPIAKAKQEKKDAKAEAKEKAASFAEVGKKFLKIETLQGGK